MILATVTPMLVGSIYYGEGVFGQVWMASNSSADKMFKGPNRIMAFGATMLLSFFLAFFLLNFNNSGINQEGDFDTFQHGVWHGIFIAITTVTPVIVINGFFGRQNWKIVAIHMLYWILTLALMGGILDAMNHWENVVLPQ